MEAVWDILYGFLVAIDTGIYKLVGWLYQLYILISSARIFRTETFEAFINRIYVVLGIVMLFFLAYALLRAIVSPDDFNNGDTSMGKIITNTVISIVIIAVLPTIFNFLYMAQETILAQNFIGKIILGNYSSASNTLEVKFDEETCEALASLEENPNSFGSTTNGCTRRYTGSGDTYSVMLAGNSIAVDIFSAFYYPALADGQDDQDTNSYNSYVNQARQAAIDAGEDPDDYADANQFYNKVFTYQNLYDSSQDFLFGTKHDLNSDEQALYRTIASYNPCHSMKEAYAYGDVAISCASDILVYHDSVNKDTKSLPLDYKSVLQYAKSTGHFDGFRLLSRTVADGHMEYSVLISTAAGIFVLYIMTSYCLDMGLRAAKLGFAQLVAPVPILARIVPKQKSMFDTWFKFTLNAYFEVFLRLIVIYLGIFMITHLPSMNGLWESSMYTNISFMNIRLPLLMDINASWGVITFAKVAVIMGILMFIKQAPNLIQQSLGISLNTGSLNIRNKIREGMLGGKAVAGAMDKVAALPGKGAGALTGYMGARMAAKNNLNGKTFVDENGNDITDQKKKEIMAAAGRNGARNGWKGGGEQYRDAYQATYADLTGDHKYKGSYFHGGKTMLEERRAADDKAYKQASTEYGEMLKQIIEKYNDLIKVQVEKLVAQYNATTSQYESSAEFAAAENRNKQNRTAEWQQSDQGRSVAESIRDYEQSAEYQRIKQEELKYNAEGTENFKAAMMDAIKKANTESSQKYMEDLKKRDDAMAEVDKKAREDTIKEFKGLYADYKEAKEQTTETITKTAEKIIESQDKNGFARYEQAKIESKNRGDFDDKKKFEDNLRNVFDKYNKEKNK